MAKITTDELLDAFKEMTLIELSEFVVAAEELVVVRGLVEPLRAEVGRRLWLRECRRRGRGAGGNSTDTASGRDRVE